MGEHWRNYGGEGTRRSVGLVEIKIGVRRYVVKIAA